MGWRLRLLIRRFCFSILLWPYCVVVDEGGASEESGASDTVLRLDRLRVGPGPQPELYNSRSDHQVETDERVRPTTRRAE